MRWPSMWFLNGHTRIPQDTVDGRNAKQPVDMVNISLFTGLNIHPRWLFGISEPSTALFLDVHIFLWMCYQKGCGLYHPTSGSTNLVSWYSSPQSMGVQQPWGSSAGSQCLRVAWKTCCFKDLRIQKEQFQTHFLVMKHAISICTCTTN